MVAISRDITGWQNIIGKPIGAKPRKLNLPAANLPQRFITIRGQIPFTVVNMNPAGFSITVIDFTPGVHPGKQSPAQIVQGNLLLVKLLGHYTAAQTDGRVPDFNKILVCVKILQKIVNQTLDV